MSDTDTTTDVTPAEDATPAPAGAPPEKPRFLDRPYVERYLVPLVLPLGVIVAVLVYALNVSRLFLSAPGHVSVVIATIITLMILCGATLLSYSPKMRTGSMALITAGFVALIVAGGAVNLGHSEEAKSAASSTLACNTPTKSTIPVQAGPNGELKFAPSSIPAGTGLVKFAISDASPAEHTFSFDNPKVQFSEVKVAGQGATASCVAFFPVAGDYTFFCSIPGHRAAGMQGVVHVTGNPTTLATAKTEAGAGGAGGATPTTKAP